MHTCATAAQDCSPLAGEIIQFKFLAAKLPQQHSAHDTFVRVSLRVFTFVRVSLPGLKIHLVTLRVSLSLSNALARIWLARIESSPNTN